MAPPDYTKLIKDLATLVVDNRKNWVGQSFFSDYDTPKDLHGFRVVLQQHLIQGKSAGESTDRVFKSACATYAQKLSNILGDSCEYTAEKDSVDGKDYYTVFYKLGVDSDGSMLYAVSMDMILNGFTFIPDTGTYMLALSGSTDGVQ